MQSPQQAGDFKPGVKQVRVTNDEGNEMTGKDNPTYAT